MNALLSSYLPIVIFIGVALAVGLALVVAPFLIAYRSPDPEKLSAYECGFNAFDDARMKFDIRYYLVSILSSFSILKSHSCFRGRHRSAPSAGLASGR